MYSKLSYDSNPHSTVRVAGKLSVLAMLLFWGYLFIDAGADKFNKSDNLPVTNISVKNCR